LKLFSTLSIGIHVTYLHSYTNFKKKHEQRFLIEPIGLMLVRGSHFNKNGQLQMMCCVNCIVQFNDDPTHVDFIRTFVYEDELLTKYTEFEFDTTSFEVQYFDSKSLTKGSRDGELGYTAVETY